MFGESNHMHMNRIRNFRFFRENCYETAKLFSTLWRPYFGFIFLLSEALLRFELGMCLHHPILRCLPAHHTKIIISATPHRQEHEKHHKPLQQQWGWIWSSLPNWSHLALFSVFVSVRGFSRLNILWKIATLPLMKKLFSVFL